MPAGQDSIDDIVLGPPLAARACGECVACCVIPEIDAPGLKKPAGEVCPNCTGSQCGIYEMRPQVCRSYFCVWRRVGALSEAARPDKIKVMFDLARPRPAQNLLAKLYIRGVAYSSWDDFLNPEVVAAIEVFKRAMLPVWLTHAGQMRLAHPSDEIARVVLNGTKPASPSVAAAAQKWIEFHARF